MTMKTLSPFLFWLLFCLTFTTPGWAEIATVKVCLTNGVCDTLTKEEFAAVSTQAFTDMTICYAQLEAAMKANDGHLAVAYLDGTGRIPSPGYTDKGKAAFERDYQQWDAAKKACWKEKP